MIPYLPVYQGRPTTQRRGFPPIRIPVPPVTILMALYNGARYLPEQLDSIARQTHRNWSLLIHDDASDDTGPTIAKAFASTLRNRNIRVLRNKRRLGAAQAFLQLVRAAPSGAIAFSDQDDVWMPEKLERAMGFLNDVPAHLPALYCGRTIVTDARLQRQGLSPRFRRPPSFGNALVQNIAAGNTIVMNETAARLLRTGAEAASDVVAHDWFAYLLITGAGGQVIFDEDPHVLYRQHTQNHVGANQGPWARFDRLCAVARGQLTDWADVNVQALKAVSPLLTPENRNMLSEFECTRSLTPFRRLAALRQLRIYRQTPAANIVLRLAALAGKL
ncbi:MAG: glycosyltransferase family 2 protein [Pseudomonadota bacterium]